MKRVGHKGAHHIAPGNTLASFDAALECGVDMIEFDVLRRHGRLLLAHDPEDAGRADVIDLAEGLDHLRATSVELDVDLKWTGYEAEVLDALRERELLGRTLISTMERESIAAIRALDPAVRVGLSVPRLRRDPRERRFVKYPAYARLGVMRELLPRRAARAIAAGRFDALMSHHALVTARLVRAVHGAGGELYAWTVDDAPRIAALEALGVDGVITNDPRLFS
ncbi:MAG: glycerophosphoryl diester phosphodiesterase [Solirubrobacterales bacterium]|nr:glycerophosphoryl diester phosphodiesterase [Solirubrobacterales bacterium]